MMAMVLVVVIANQGLLSVQNHRGGIVCVLVLMMGFGAATSRVMVLIVLFVAAHGTA